MKAAWVFKCAKQRDRAPKPKEVTIRPNCLSVERAIIFFVSHSSEAAKPAIKVVKIPTFRSKVEIRGQKRNNRYTPAVTKVEECTKAETGVGASMAAGSQLENGTCADFVKLMTSSRYNAQDISETDL